MKKDSLIFYASHYEILKNLSDEEFGKLYKALFEYSLGNEVDIPEKLKIPFGLVKNQMVLDSEKYAEKCQKNQENGKKGGRPKKPNGFFENPEKANGFFENPNDNDNENDNENDSKENSTKENNQNNSPVSEPKTSESKKRFVKPTVEEVKTYCLERKNSVDAERFVDYYTTNGWRVGRNPMKDWKAAVRTWEKNSKDGRNGAPLSTNWDGRNSTPPKSNLSEKPTPEWLNQTIEKAELADDELDELADSFQEFY